MMLFLRKIFLICLILSAVQCSPRAPSYEIVQKVEDQIEALEVYSGESNDDISGIIAIYKDSNLLFNRAFGYADIGQRVENSYLTKFRIGSVSKPITAVAVMTLVDSGLINLSDKISDYLTQVRNGEKITVRQVLSHTSGLDDVFRIEGYMDFALQPSSLDEKIEFFNKADLLFEPGSDWSYSNLGYIILARLVEVVSGQDFAEYVELTIFKPLEMLNSGSDHEAKIIYNMARGYVPHDDGSIRYPEHIIMSGVIGAGSFYSTAEDLQRFVMAVQTPGLLSQEAIRNMFTPCTENIERLGGDGYGLGWRIGTTNGVKRISHSGGINGYLANVDWFIEENIVAIVLTNSQSLGFLRGRDALRKAITSTSESE